MKIVKIENAPLTGLTNLDEVFGWPGATLKIIGEGFGQQGLQFIALTVGMKKLPLVVKSWSDKEIVAEVPANVPSRGYRLAVFRNAPPTPPSKRATATASIAIAASTTKLKTAITEPVDARTLNIPAMTRLLNSLSPVSNVVTIFIALGPIKPGTDGFQATYRTQIEQYAAKHGLSKDWVSYMFNVNQLYLLLFNKFKTQYDDELVVSYTYGPKGSKGLKQPFASENQHMELLRAIFQSIFVGPSYKWRVVFGESFDPYVRIIGLTDTPMAEAAGQFISFENTIYSKIDGVLVHELFHKMGMFGHHYENQPAMVTGEKCLFNKTGGVLCHGCCAAAGIDYNASLAGLAYREEKAKELKAHFFDLVV